MSIAGSAGGDVKTAMARVVGNIPDGTTNNTSEAVRIENGDGDRTIHGVQVTTRITNADDLSEEQGLHVTWDGGAYFGATDGKPSANEYVDESNYLGRYQWSFHYETRFDASNTTGTGAASSDQAAVTWLDGDDVTREWQEGVTLSFAISSITSGAFNIGQDIAVIVDYVVY